MPKTGEKTDNTNGMQKKLAILKNIYILNIKIIINLQA
jgi:hypothetical protein